MGEAGVAVEIEGGEGREEGGGGGGVGGFVEGEVGRACGGGDKMTGVGSSLRCSEVLEVGGELMLYSIYQLDFSCSLRRDHYRSISGTCLLMHG